jgi:biotin carboxylase
VIENGGELPSLISDKIKEEVHNLVVKAAKSMGIKQGSVKADIVLTKDGPKVIELAARLSGGYFCTHEIPLSAGVNIVKAMIKISLGQKPDFEELVPKYQKGVAIRFLFPTPGIAKRIIGVREVKRQKWVKAMQVYVRPGDILEEITCHPKRAGFVLCVGNTRQEAVKRAEEAIRKIKIELAS